MNLFHESKKILDKDGSVNPLGPYGKMKLTGQEVAIYFRKNKVSDPKVKKAVEVALDMSGAYDVAQKEIKKFFGSSILKKKEVQHALKYANEEKITETTDKEINAVKKLSKDQQAVLKDYQKITKLGDKELKNTKHNPTYKAILDARDKVLTLIGTLQTDKLLKGEDLEESIRDVEKEYIDREWVQIVRKHKNAIKKFWRTGQLDDKAEEDLVGYAMDMGDIRTDDVDETDEWLHDIILSNEETNLMNTYRKMWEDGQKYAPIEEGKVHDSIIRRDFPNVWAASAKDKKILKNFHAVVDTNNYKKMKDAYKKDMKSFVDSLREETISEKYKPWSDSTYPRCVDFYIQFRGGKGDRITSPENKKDFEKAKKMIDSYCRKNKIKQKPVYSTPEEGSSAYKVGLMIDKTYSKTDDYDRGVDLQPLYVELGKLKTAEDHGGGWSKPHGQDEDVSEKKDKIKYRGNLRGLMEETVSEGKKFQQKDIDIVAKLTDRNEHTLSLMHIANKLGDKKMEKKLSLIAKLHMEYGSMTKDLMNMRNEIFDDIKKQLKKFDNGQDMYGAL